MQLVSNALPFLATDTGSAIRWSSGDALAALYFSEWIELAPRGIRVGSATPLLSTGGESCIPAQDALCLFPNNGGAFVPSQSWLSSADNLTTTAFPVVDALTAWLHMHETGPRASIAMLYAQQDACSTNGGGRELRLSGTVYTVTGCDVLQGHLVAVYDGHTLRLVSQSFGPMAYCAVLLQAVVCLYYATTIASSPAPKSPNNNNTTTIADPANNNDEARKRKRDEDRLSMNRVLENQPAAQVEPEAEAGNSTAADGIVVVNAADNNNNGATPYSGKSTRKAAFAALWLHISCLYFCATSEVPFLIASDAAHFWAWATVGLLLSIVCLVAPSSSSERAGEACMYALVSLTNIIYRTPENTYTGIACAVLLVRQWQKLLTWHLLMRREARLAHVLVEFGDLLATTVMLLVLARLGAAPQSAERWPFYAGIATYIGFALALQRYKRAHLQKGDSADDKKSKRD